MVSLILYRRFILNRVSLTICSKFELILYKNFLLPFKYACKFICNIHKTLAVSLDYSRRYNIVGYLTIASRVLTHFRFRLNDLMPVNHNNPNNLYF